MKKYKQRYKRAISLINVFNNDTKTLVILKTHVRNGYFNRTLPHWFYFLSENNKYNELQFTIVNNSVSS